MTNLQMCVLTTSADIQLGRLGPLLEQCRPEWETFRLMRIHTYIRHDTLLCLCPIASSLFSLVIIHSNARRHKLGLSQSVRTDQRPFRQQAEREVSAGVLHVGRHLHCIRTLRASLCTIPFPSFRRPGFGVPHVRNTCS